jgi:hypothetical protein
VAFVSVDLSGPAVRAMLLLIIVGCTPGKGDSRETPIARRDPVRAAIAAPSHASTEGSELYLADTSASAANHDLVPQREAFANLDPSDDAIVGPPDAVPDCEEKLGRAGVAFRAAALPIHTHAKMVCGAPQVVIYVRGPGKITYVPSPLLTCSMALALASFEGILQEEANRIFGSPVVRIEQLGTYSCRDIAAYKGIVSEHSYANAIDLARFRLKNGKTFSILNDFDMRDGVPARPAGALLRIVSQRSYDEDVFSNVLTPFWDAHHKDHFHLDLARYRVNGVRPSGA